MKIIKLFTSVCTLVIAADICVSPAYAISEEVGVSTTTKSCSRSGSEFEITGELITDVINVEFFMLETRFVFRADGIIIDEGRIVGGTEHSVLNCDPVAGVIGNCSSGSRFNVASVVSPQVADLASDVTVDSEVTLLAVYGADREIEIITTTGGCTLPPINQVCSLTDNLCGSSGNCLPSEKCVPDTDGRPKCEVDPICSRECTTPGNACGGGGCKDSQVCNAQYKCVIDNINCGCDYSHEQALNCDGMRDCPVKYVCRQNEISGAGECVVDPECINCSPNTNQCGVDPCNLRQKCMNGVCVYAYEQCITDELQCGDTSGACGANGECFGWQTCNWLPLMSHGICRDNFIQCRTDADNDDLFCAPGILNTALGCIKIDNPTSTIAFFLKWGFGVVGGSGLLLLTFATIQLITSSGNPDRIKGAKEQYVAVITGILLLIFSVIILEAIGVNILQLPGL